MRAKTCEGSMKCVRGPGFCPVCGCRQGEPGCGLRRPTASYAGAARGSLVAGTRWRQEACERPSNLLGREADDGVEKRED